MGLIILGLILIGIGYANDNGDHQGAAVACWAVGLVVCLIGAS
jgi:hypothetical protein